MGDAPSNSRSGWVVRPHVQNGGLTISWTVGPEHQVPGIDQPGQAVFAVVKDSEARAYLVAAVPDLLEAGIALLDFVEDTWPGAESVEMMRAALLRAGVTR